MTANRTTRTDDTTKTKTIIYVNNDMYDKQSESSIAPTISDKK